MQGAWSSNGDTDFICSLHILKSVYASRGCPMEGFSSSRLVDQPSLPASSTSLVYQPSLPT